MLNEVQQDCTGYELAVGSITGFRKFSVDRLGRLTGLHYQSVWKPGENTASCRRQNHERYCIGMGFTRCRCPEVGVDALHGDDCPCGFYAYLDCGEKRYGDLGKRLTVGAIIEGYGKTVVGTKGFRCQKAKVIAVVVPLWTRLRKRAVVKALRENYPDVKVIPSKRLAARRFGVTLKAAKQTSATDPEFWERKADLL